MLNHLEIRGYGECAFVKHAYSRQPGPTTPEERLPPAFMGFPQTASLSLSSKITSTRRELLVKTQAETGVQWIPFPCHVYRAASMAQLEGSQLVTLTTRGSATWEQKPANDTRVVFTHPVLTRFVSLLLLLSFQVQ